MGTLSDLSPHHFEKRKVFILRLWARGQDQPVWIGEIQDISTGKISHVQGLEALFDWLKQQTSQASEPHANKKQ